MIRDGLQDGARSRVPYHDPCGPFPPPDAVFPSEYERRIANVSWYRLMGGTFVLPRVGQRVKLRCDLTRDDAYVPKGALGTVREVLNAFGRTAAIGVVMDPPAVPDAYGPTANGVPPEVVFFWFNDAENAAPGLEDQDMLGVFWKQCDPVKGGAA